MPPGRPPPELAGGFVTRRGRLCGRKSRLSAEHAQARRLERCPEDRGVGAELNQGDIGLLAGDAFATDTTFSSRPPLRRTHARTHARPDESAARIQIQQSAVLVLQSAEAPTSGGFDKGAGLTARSMYYIACPVEEIKKDRDRDRW